MTRFLAGVFDPPGRTPTRRLDRALDPLPAAAITAGPLHLVHTGPGPAEGGVLCLFDGHLDNARELTLDLGLGGQLAVERLLSAGWRRWGEELLPRLRGDFVLLLWDREREGGLLARDQLGVRSLFLHEAGGALYFATEVRHLLAMLPRRPGPDPVGVAHWIALSARPGSGTVYEGVRRLDPGGVVLLDQASARERRYWEPRFAPPLRLSGAELEDRARAAMEVAVNRQLSPGGQSGVMMSGGLDSASVAALAAKVAPGRVSAYSAAFPEHPAVDEAELIDQLRVALGLAGVTAAVRPGGLLASAVEASQAWQVPLSSWGDFWATPLLRAAAARGVEVMLGGDGGDELFGARIGVLGDRLRAGRPRQALGFARSLPGAGERMPWRTATRVMRDWGLSGALPYRVHDALRRRRAPGRAPDWMRPQAVRDLVDTGDPLAWKRLDGPRSWGYTAHTLTRGVEEAGVFEDHRHRALAAGLEVRHPLFDLDLLEFALALPAAATFDPYVDRPLMRAAMRGLLPDQVRMRPQKARFDSLLVDSLTGPDWPAIHRLLTEPRAEIGAYVAQDRLERGLLDVAAGDPFAWMAQLWRLITIECWLRAQGNPLPGAAGSVAPGAADIELRPVEMAL